MRCFLAIDLPDDAIDALERIQLELPFGRLSDPETFHLTLAFLGELSDDEAEAAHEAVSELPPNPVPVRINGLGLFGGNTPSVLYANVDPDPALLALEKTIRSRLHGAGVQLERRRYHPHITLSRFKPHMPPESVAQLGTFVSAHAGFSLPEFLAGEFAFYRSILGGPVPIHEPLARYSLI